MEALREEALSSTFSLDYGAHLLWGTFEQIWKLSAGGPNYFSRVFCHTA